MYRRVVTKPIATAMAGANFNCNSTSMKALVFTFVLFLALALPSRAGTCSVTVSVMRKYADGQGGEQTYSLKDIKGSEALLPIELQAPRLLSAGWSGVDEKGVRELYVSLQDPSIIVPGTVTPTTTVLPAPLETFRVTLSFTPGQKQLLYTSPTESLSIQIDEDKK